MPRPSASPISAQAKRVSLALAKLYPNAHCALDYTNPFQILIATILSAQCTDKTVNKVTPGLFHRYPDAAAFAQADLADVETLIKPTGFFRNKAKNIIACAQTLVNEHGGQVPDSLEALTKLPGVGRKTANVVLGNAFDIPGMVVDTHIGRLSRRLGLTKQTDPVKVEQELMKLYPSKEWTILGHRLIFHGRQVCDAKKPKCGECTMEEFCPKIGVNSIKAK